MLAAMQLRKRYQ